MRITLLVLCLLTSACSLLPEVKPWERKLLAEERMQPDVHRMELLADDKTYWSKEAAFGGQNFGGGGCGCN